MFILLSLSNARLKIEQCKVRSFRLKKSSNLFITFPVAIRLRVTPVPIPNTTVKTHTAEDTTLVTMWQNRWLPVFIKIITIIDRLKMPNAL